MGTLQSAIQIHDGMSSALRSMHNALNTVVSTFEILQDTSAQAIDVNSIKAARGELANAGAALTVMEEQTKRAGEQQKRFNEDIRNGGNEADNLLSKIKGFVGSYVGIQGIQNAKNWLEESLGLSDVQINVERQLQNVLRNVGATEDAFESLKTTASSIQGYSLYDGEAMLAGAGEISTYMKDTAAIQHMMGTLANYAAGMSGGGELDTKAMTDYATQLGKVTIGAYDGITKKGFELTDAQKKIIETGTDMEKSLVIDDVISQSWGHLAETMANTPQGKIIQMKNDIGDIREEVGMGLYPIVIQFVDMVKSNMPQIRDAMLGFGQAAGTVAIILFGLLNGAIQVYDFISSNWSLISPIIFGIVGAMMAYQAITLANNIAQGVGVAIQTAQAIAIAVKTKATIADVAKTKELTVAQWALNSAMLANPITIIIIAIIALIAITYLVVAAMNKFAGTSVSATGIICGAFMVAAAFIGNLIIGLLNALIQYFWTRFVEPFLGIIEFILNATNGGFNSFGDAVANLIGQVISWFLSLGKVVTKIIDAIFGTDWTSGLSSLQDNVLSWGKNENAITIERKAPTINHRFEYGKAWDTGYDWGAGLKDKFKLDAFDPMAWDNPWEGIEASSADTAANTAAMKDSMSIAEEDLKYLRDIAEQEAINRFTTASLKVEMTNHNNINSNLDLDGIFNDLTDGVSEIVNSAAEGVHR